MNYLLDKKVKRKKYIYAVLFPIVLLILFYFRTSIFRGLAYTSQKFFLPVLILGHNIGEKFSNTRSFFASKNSLMQDNEKLKLQLDASAGTMLNYNSLLAENNELKDILGRKQEKETMVLAVILGMQNQSPYGSLIIDAGAKNLLKEGDIVFALGNVPIGRIAAVYPNSAKVVLLTNAGEKTQASINDALMEVIGRGGGNFEMIMPRDFALVKGDQATLPGIFPYVLGTVETIISDPRDPFVKALLVSPVNVQALKFVEVRVQR
jgi:rod shape-determining protein MreC